MTLKQFLDLNTNIDLSYQINYNWKYHHYTKKKKISNENQIDTEFLLATVLDFFVSDDMTLCVGIDYYE